MTDPRDPQNEEDTPDVRNDPVPEDDATTAPVEPTTEDPA